MNDEEPTLTDEIDCEVTANDGSWMTCDMITDDDIAEAEDDSA